MSSVDYGDIVKRDEIAEWRAPVLTREMADALRAATATQHGAAFPATFSTTFRKPEFAWLKDLKVNMRNLLHTEQEYEFHSSFEVGDEPLVRTKVESSRERAGMRFVTLMSEISSGGKLRVVSRSSFVVREGEKA